MKNNCMNTKKLMLIDDDRDDRFFFHLVVEELAPKFELTMVKNGKEALYQLRHSDKLPDYIFLDLNMYEMPGKQCLLELKNDERLKNIPVVIYTTSAYPKDMQDCLELGAVHYLQKPFDLTMLSSEIVNIIESVEHRIHL